MTDIDISVNIPAGTVVSSESLLSFSSAPITLTANVLSDNITISFGQTLSSIPNVLATVISVGSDTANPTGVTGFVNAYVNQVTKSSCILKAISSVNQQAQIKILVIK